MHIIFVTTEPPGPPIKFEPTKIGQDNVTLQWKAPKENGGSKITSYHLKKKVRSTGDWEKVTTLSEFDLNYKVPNLKENVEHYFSVCAENKAGIGPAAETDKVIPIREASKYSIILL